MFQKLSNILLILLISLKLFPSRFLFSQSSENYLSNYIFFKILYNKQFSILLKYYDLRKFLRGKEKINHLRKKCERNVKISTIIHFDDETRNNYAKLEKRVFEKTTNIDRCVHDDKRAQKCFGRYHCLADTRYILYPRRVLAFHGIMMQAFGERGSEPLGDLHSRRMPPTYDETGSFSRLE